MGEYLFWFIIINIPLIAGVGLLLFMASGKGKPKPTQTELEERITQTQSEKDAWEKRIPLLVVAESQ